MKDNLKDALFNDEDVKKMDIYWTYFSKFWMSSSNMIKSWNINDYVGNINTLKRTNNGLERYNRSMKSLFNAGTPSFADFVNTMKEESEAQQQKVEHHMNQTIVKRKN